MPTYCHGNNESFRMVRLQNRPYLNIVGPRPDGRWSVGWLFYGVDEYGMKLDQPIVCRDCGFIFSGQIV